MNHRHLPPLIEVLPTCSDADFDYIRATFARELQRVTDGKLVDGVIAFAVACAADRLRHATRSELAALLSTVKDHWGK